MPSACAAMPMRPPSSARIAILNPSPSAPSRASSPTAQSVRNTCALGAPRMPSLSSGGPILSPGASVGTTKAVMPRLPFAGSVVANTIISVGDRRVGDEVLRAGQQPARRRRARRASAGPSRPSPPRARTARSSRSFARRPGRAASARAGRRSPRRGSARSTSELCTDITTAVEAQARAISSSATAYDRASIPAPPHFSGTMTPSSPSSPRRAKISLREAVGAVDLGGGGRDLARREVAGGVPDQLLLGGELEVHVARPDRRALLDEGAHAFLLIVGREQRREELALDARGPSSSGRAAPAAKRPLGGGDGERRLGGDLGGDGRAPAASAPPARRPRCTRPMRSASSASMIVARVDQLARARDADAAREPLRAAEARDHAQADLGHARAWRRARRR